MSQFHKTMAAAVPLCVGGFFISTLPAAAVTPFACTWVQSSLTLNCTGLATTLPASLSSTTPWSTSQPLPVVIYDGAALTFPPQNGGNSYPLLNSAYSGGWNPNPPTVTVNFDANTSIAIVNPTSAQLADKALITANYSNTESVNGDGVNNVVLNNAGSLALSTNQISTTRMEVINSDSQVNTFTVNNTGTVAVTQTFFTTFSTANLALKPSTTPATLTTTYSATYSGATLNDMGALYSDDNTNEFTLNNSAAGQALATGNYATVYYGRADTTIDNYGLISNTTWTSTDTIANGHWAIAAWAGTDYDVAPNTNPDSNIVIPPSSGNFAMVDDTSALTLTNYAGGTIKGDIIAMDITPLVYAAAVGSSTNPFPDPSSTSLLPYTISSSSAGPRDSNIENDGTITGNFYLGSGTHVIDNAAGASITGNADVDQRPIQAVFTEVNEVTPGTAGVYVNNVNGTDNNGTPCGTAATTTDAGCATTSKATLEVVGGQSLTLTNEGTWAGNIDIFDESTSVNNITLTGSGFTGSVSAVNGTGSNTLTLDGVTSLKSVQNFSTLNLGESNVNITSADTSPTQTAVYLVSNKNGGATLSTTIYGQGGTTSSPSTNLGSLNFTNGGSLSFSSTGTLTIDPTFAGPVANGSVYELANNFTGNISNVSVNNTSYLVTLTPSDGPLLLNATVMNANNVPGISNAGASVLNNLINYNGANPQTQAIGGAVANLTTAAAVANAGAQLRPEVNGASIQVPIEIATDFEDNINIRLQSYFLGALPQPATEPGFPTASGAPTAPVVPTNGIWFNALGSSLHQRQDANVSGYVADLGGFVVGYDHTITDNFRAGGAVGYGVSSISDTVLANHTSLDTVNGLLYGSYTGQNWYVNGIGSYGSLHYDASRNINFPGFTDTAFAGRSGALYSGRVEGGYAFITPVATFVPIASLTYAHIDQAAYAETSFNGAGLSVADQQTDSLRSGLGGQVIVPLAASPAFAAAWESHAIWLHEFENTAENVTAGFVGSGSTFNAVGPNPSSEMADLGTDVRITLPAAGDSLSVGYTAVLRNQYLEQIGLVRARFDF